MGKRAVWFEDDLEERLKAVHEAMQKDPVLRNLRLKWADALKLLLRGALDRAELEYMNKLPDNVDPEEALEMLEKDYYQRKALLISMREKWRLEMSEKLSKKKSS